MELTETVRNGDNGDLLVSRSYTTVVRPSS
jgi:hypothetical protein